MPNPIELVETITANWGLPLHVLFDKHILPCGEPKEWSTDLLSALVTLSSLTAINEVAPHRYRGWERRSRVRDLLSDLCTTRAEEFDNPDSLAAIEAAVMTAADVELITAGLKDRVLHLSHSASYQGDARLGIDGMVLLTSEYVPKKEVPRCLEKEELPSLETCEYGRLLSIAAGPRPSITAINQSRRAPQTRELVAYSTSPARATPAIQHLHVPSRLTAQPPQSKTPPHIPTPRPRLGLKNLPSILNTPTLNPISPASHPAARLRDPTSPISALPSAPVSSEAPISHGASTLTPRLPPLHLNPAPATRTYPRIRAPSPPSFQKLPPSNIHDPTKSNPACTDLQLELESAQLELEIAELKLQVGRLKRRICEIRNVQGGDERAKRVCRD